MTDYGMPKEDFIGKKVKYNDEYGVIYKVVRNGDIGIVFVDKDNEHVPEDVFIYWVQFDGYTRGMMREHFELIEQKNE